MILFSIWAGFILRDMGGFMGSGAGGKHGLYMSNWLVSFAGYIGTAMVLLTVTVVFLFL